MEVTILGTANPCPNPERAGSSIALSTGEDTVLIDCGPWATYRLVEYDINFVEIEDLFFTHQHMDHNASFFHFVLASWYLGRDELTVYGPPQTRDLVRGFEVAYNDHIRDTSEWRHRPPDGMTDIEIENVTEQATYSGNGWEATCLEVDHSYYLDVYAYRFEDTETGRSMVFSGDTTPLATMSEFAEGADLLIHDCNIVGETEEPLAPEDVNERYAHPPYDDYLSWIMSDEAEEEQNEINHTTPASAGRIAEEANVDTLVLTHFNPLRNPDDIYSEASAEFSGETVVAEDGMTFNL